MFENDETFRILIQQLADHTGLPAHMMRNGGIHRDQVGAILQAAFQRLKEANARALAEEEFLPSELQDLDLAPASAVMQRMLRTYFARRSTYGPSEQVFADVMVALFPGGLTLKTRTDWLRYGLFHHLPAKLARYASDWGHPHVDSIHDIGPYSAMLETEDRRHLGQEPFKK